VWVGFGSPTPFYKKARIMFFQSLIYILLIVGFFYALWRLVLKDLLRAQGIEVDDPEVDPLTAMELKRDGLQAKLDKLHKDADAAETMVDMTAEIKELEQQIADAETAIKNLKS
jgi:septal ring factor EnvC (AmiA/AmiB activator)